MGHCQWVIEQYIIQYNKTITSNTTNIFTDISVSKERKEGRWSLNQDEGSYMLIHTYDRYLATSHLYHGKNWKKNWRTEQASSDEGLWQRPKRQGRNVGCVWSNSFIIVTNQPKNMFHIIPYFDMVVWSDSWCKETMLIAPSSEVW